MAAEQGLEALVQCLGRMAWAPVARGRAHYLHDSFEPGKNHTARPFFSRGLKTARRPRRGAVCHRRFCTIASRVALSRHPLGPYEIAARIGAGGMGEVYKRIKFADVIPVRDTS